MMNNSAEFARLALTEETRLNKHSAATTQRDI
jgi:hypothetical protein